MNLDEYVRFVEPSFDSAIIGVSHDYRLIYSYNIMIEEYMDQHQCSADEAMEWIEVNIIPSLPYYENSPIILMEYHNYSLI